LKDQQRLAALIAKFTPSDGMHDTAIPSLKLIRRSHPSETIHSVYTPSLCIIAQGSKIASLADETYQYDSSAYLVASVHLPISGQIVDASPEKPYLCAQLNFSTEDILDIASETRPEQEQSLTSEARRALWVKPFNQSLMDAMLRLVQLLDRPEDIHVLAPLIVREIIYRILRDDQNGVIEQFAMIGSHAHGIAKAVHLIRRDYARPLRIESLAKEVNMSASTLHKHFKSVTAMSPLQYQKAIRLQEARRLLLSEQLDAADAAFKVGYESPSQFSREYSRMFGLPPISDLKQQLSTL